MQTHQQAWKTYCETLKGWFTQHFQRYTLVRVTRRCSFFVLITLLVLEINIGFNGGQAFAQSACPRNVLSYVVKRGDTLSRIASHYHVDWRRLAANNHVTNPNRIYRGQVLCINGASSHHGQPTQPTRSNGPGKQRGPTVTRNVFPFGACTWWADQRYFQLHGHFVPWQTQATAWQWVARAYQFGWRVSTKASPGAIVVLQPWVEGAYGSGHVAVVERILKNGHVIASNMSWGSHPLRITYVQFAPGPGVRFISQ